VKWWDKPRSLSWSAQLYLLLRLFSQDFCRVSVIVICTQLQAQHPENAGQEWCYILPVLGGTRVFDFINNRWFQFLWVVYQSQRIVNSGYLKIRNQRTIGCFQLFWKRQRTILFREVTKPRINGFLGWLFGLFQFWESQLCTKNEVFHIWQWWLRVLLRTTMIPSGCLVQVSNISATLDNTSMVAKKQSAWWINTKRHYSEENSRADSFF
jgi:hypothetical protein